VRRSLAGWYAKGWTAQYAKAGSPAEGSDEFKKLLDECWHPKIKIDNIADKTDEVSTFTMCLDVLTGRMHRFMKFRGDCSQILNLRDFPFDSQATARRSSTSETSRSTRSRSASRSAPTATRTTSSSSPTPAAPASTVGA
jgi:hypothetical protein